MPDVCIIVSMEERKERHADPKSFWTKRASNLDPRNASLCDLV